MYFYVNVHMFVYVVCTLVWNIFVGINMRSLVKLSISPYIVYVCTYVEMWYFDICIYIAIYICNYTFRRNSFSNNGMAYIPTCYTYVQTYTIHIYVHICILIYVYTYVYKNVIKTCLEQKWHKRAQAGCKNIYGKYLLLCIDSLLDIHMYMYIHLYKCKYVTSKKF